MGCGVVRYRLYILVLQLHNNAQLGVFCGRPFQVGLNFNPKGRPPIFAFLNFETHDSAVQRTQNEQVNHFDSTWTPPQKKHALPPPQKKKTCPPPPGEKTKRPPPPQEKHGLIYSCSRTKNALPRLARSAEPCGRSAAPRRPLGLGLQRRPWRRLVRLTPDEETHRFTSMGVGILLQ